MADPRRGDQRRFQHRNRAPHNPIHVNPENQAHQSNLQNQNNPHNEIRYQRENHDLNNSNHVDPRNQTNPPCNHERILGFKYFENLLNNIPLNIISILYLDKHKIKKLFTKETIGPELLQTILKVFAKACSCLHRENLTRFLAEFDSDSFIIQVQKYLLLFLTRPVTLEQIDSLEDILEFLSVYKATLPTIGSQTFLFLSPSLKITIDKVKLNHASSKIADISKKIDYIEEKIKHLGGISEQDMKKLERDEASQIKDTPCDFRSVSILPTADDIIDIKPFIRHKLKDGKFQDVEHYLDVQFHLLREDFLKPLREGIIEYKILCKNAKKGFYVKDLRIYRGISFIKTVHTEGGILNVIKFDNRSFKNINWETSKRLIHGTLVCFSKDNLETMFFGTVIGRKVELLKEGYLEIQLDNLTWETLNELGFYSYIMFETNAYFEAYKHNLKGLQQFTAENFPFKKYIVDVEKIIKHPAYLNVNTAFDFSSLMKGFDKIKYKKVPLLDINKWPKANELGLDNAQYQAFQGALIKELAIIQGPPVTGKTFLGLKIVQLIMENYDVWNYDNSPILIVCYTNHALDQFLEGILKFTQSIVRVGGRCQSPALKDFQINEVRRHIQIKTIYSDIKMELKGIERQVYDIEKIVNVAFSKIMQLHCFDKLILPNHFRALKSSRGSLVTWLQLDLFNTNNSNTEDLMYHGLSPDFENMTIQQAEEELPENGEADVEFINAMRDIDMEDFRHDYDVLKEVAKIDNENVTTLFEKKKTCKNQDRIQHLLNIKDFMTVEEEAAISDIFRLQLRDRWRLYRLWVSLFAKHNHNQIKKVQRKYIDLSKQLKELRMAEDINIVKKARIVGMTTTGAAKYSYINNSIKFKIVIVEEAAEVLEAHILTSLSNKTEHLILIGDRQQLRPSPTIYKLAKDYNLDLSLFERMISNGLERHQLVTQHRMRPCISQLLVPHIYKNLQDHESVKTFENIMGMSTNMFFLSHDHNELKVDDTKSRSNLFEAEFLAAACKYLVLQGYNSSQITILTTYSGQMFAIKSLIAPNPLLKGVRVTVVDNFQGEENDIILVSFVRSNKEEMIGFLNISDRICVALSRARIGLFCVGNFNLLANKSPLWKNISTYLEANKYIGNVIKIQCQEHPEIVTEIKCAEDFNKVAEGGCTKPCIFRLDCGHSCTRICHPYDPDHLEFKCRKSCEKTICPNNHKCQKPCFTECGDCVIFMPKIIPTCGHEAKMKCSENLYPFECRKECRKYLSCGHKCSNWCSDKICECSEKFTVPSPCGHNVEIRCKNREKINEIKLLDCCKEPCLEELACGHFCSGTCSECYNSRIHVPCKDPCKRVLICGHTCTSPCSQQCPPCKKKLCITKCHHNRCPKTCGVPCEPCNEKCEWACPHKKCTRLCKEYCSRKPCDIPCPEKLKCGHPCMGYCGEPCPKLCGVCNNEELREILFGTEDEEDARFVLLEDCNHILESTGLQGWLEQENGNEILLKVCPKCKATIFKNYRFGDLIKRGIKNIEDVKKVIFGTREERNNLIKAIDVAYMSLSSDIHLRDSFDSCLKKFENLINTEKYRQNNYNKSDLTLLLQLITFLNELSNTLIKFKTSSTILNARPSSLFDSNAASLALCNSLKAPAEECLSIILKTINRNVQFSLCPNQIDDLAKEIQRLKLMIHVYHYLFKFATNPKSLPLFEDLVHKLQVRAPFTEEAQERAKKIFKEATKLGTGLGITLEEKSRILKAMGLNKGHWFKCPNGHIYVIADSGSAIVESVCNECKATIGGSHFT